jgi:hypothetical protein
MLRVQNSLPQRSSCLSNTLHNITYVLYHRKFSWWLNLNESSSGWEQHQMVEQWVNQCFQNILCSHRQGTEFSSLKMTRTLSLLAVQSPDAAANLRKFCWFQWCLCCVHWNVIYWPLSMVLTKNLHSGLVGTINSSITFKMFWHTK